MMKRIATVFCALLLLLAVVPASADYESCREAKCGAGVSCKQCNNAINVCCRNEYDSGTATIAQYVNCTTANSLGYAQCTAGQGTDSGGGDDSGESDKAFLSGLARSRDQQVALRTAMELLRFALDLPAGDSADANEK